MSQRLIQKEKSMERAGTVVAVFTEHAAADSAVKALLAADFKTSDLSVVGKGFHSEEKVLGFYNIGDRVKFWGSRGAFWGGLWGFFFGGLFLTIPVLGPVVAVGYLATTIISAVESAILVGGLSALGAALYSLGIPKDTVIEYEAAVATDGFLVMAHGTPDEINRATAILKAANPTRLETHPISEPAETSINEKETAK